MGNIGIAVDTVRLFLAGLASGRYATDHEVRAGAAWGLEVAGWEMSDGTPIDGIDVLGLMIDSYRVLGILGATVQQKGKIGESVTYEGRAFAADALRRLA